MCCSPARLLLLLEEANPVDSIVQAVTNAVNATTSGVVIAYDRVDNFTRDAGAVPPQQRITGAWQQGVLAMHIMFAQQAPDGGQWLGEG